LELELVALYRLLEATTKKVVNFVSAALRQNPGCGYVNLFQCDVLVATE